MKASDLFTHVENAEDLVYLKTRVFPVNIRLFKSNPDYKKLIWECQDLIRKAALTKADGYKLPHGMSGANLAIPFNIVAYVTSRGTSQSNC